MKKLFSAAVSAFIIGILFPCCVYAHGSIDVSDFKPETYHSFSIKGCKIFYDSEDFEVVGNVVGMLRDDIFALTGEKPDVAKGALPEIRLS